MAVPNTPTNFNVQTANRQVFLSWDIDTDADTFDVERSPDQETWSVLDGAATGHTYLDTTANVGTEYWYRIRGTNIDGDGAYTDPQMVIAAPTGEMSLWMLRLSAQERADRPESEFLTLKEWNKWINLAYQELYDLIISTSEDYIMSDPLEITSDGTQSYDLPNGSNHSGADPIYKLRGVDIQVGNGEWLPIKKFNFRDRNKYNYPNGSNTANNIQGIRYRLVGDQIRFTRVISGGQRFRLWYNPRISMLLQDTDLTEIGQNGWLEYVIIRAARYALAKEESDTRDLDKELVSLTLRIQAMKDERDSGEPDTIADVRTHDGSNNGDPWGPIGWY